MITNIDVTIHSTRYALAWVKDGLRYHVWLDRTTRAINDDGPTLYKNPPLGTPHRGEGYFTTRHLNLRTKQNYKDFSYALEFAKTNDIFERAESQDKAQKDAEHLKHMQLLRRRQLERSGPALYEALQQIMLPATFNSFDQIQNIAKKAIEEADKA